MLILATGLAAAVVPVTGASAQYYGGGYGRDRVRHEQRECNRELRRADSRREYRRELRECRREIARARAHERRRYWDGHRWRNRGW